VVKPRCADGDPHAVECGRSPTRNGDIIEFIFSKLLLYPLSSEWCEYTPMGNSSSNYESVVFCTRYGSRIEVPRKNYDIDKCRHFNRTVKPYDGDSEIPRLVRNAFYANKPVYVTRVQMQNIVMLVKRNSMDEAVLRKFKIKELV